LRNKLAIAVNFSIGIVSLIAIASLFSQQNSWCELDHIPFVVELGLPSSRIDETQISPESGGNR